MKRLTIKAPSGLIHLKNNTETTMNAAIKKLSDLEDLEEQGKLLKLPCAVGDTLHFLCREHFGDYFAENHGDILSIYVKNIVFSDPSYGINFDSYELLLDDIGKTVFLTKESAEAALKELEGKQ